MRPRLILAAMTALVALAAVLLPASPASAVDAWNRCTQGTFVPEYDTKIAVRGNGGGSFPAEAVPANLIEPGDVFYVIPLTGTTVSMGGTVGNVGPDGNGAAAPAGWPFPGLKQYSGVLRFNNNPLGWRKQPSQATGFNTCVPWNDSVPVRLLFYVNDPQTSDNSGQWDFDILVFKANAPVSVAMDNCQRARTPQYSEFITVAGNGGGSFPSGPNPANVLANGDVFTVETRYREWVGMGGGAPSVEPYGNNIPAPAGWPFPSLFQYSAVMRFNNNPGGWVLSPVHAAAFAGCHLWTDPTQVRLLFYVNDTYTGDNSGSWHFTVSIYKKNGMP